MAESNDWKDVETLIDEQKYEEAAKSVAGIREAARSSNDVVQWTKALIKETQLRLALHGYETTVRFFREQPWPDDARSRAVLNLYYAHGLMTYIEAYSWEIDRRERVESTAEVDLKAWTREEIFQEAVRAFSEVWAQRDVLGREPVTALGEYLWSNTYPREIRGTLRDATTYLFVELLANTGNWRPEQSNELFMLDLASLIRGEHSKDGIALADMAVHPLLKIGAILADLETWHIGNDRPEAALEVRLERLRRLWASFTQRDDRMAIREDLKTRLPRLRGLEWWAEGMAQLAEFVRQGDHPNSLVEARAIAQEGHKAYPGSLGGRHCQAIISQIEHPDYGITSMTSDKAQARSIQVSHKNLSKLYFRAYKLDLEDWIRSAKDRSLLPARDDVKSLVRGQSPYLELVQWDMDLPETPDYRLHRTFATPPMETSGFYILVASARSDFSPDDNRLFSVPFIVSDLVIVSRQDETGALEGRVVSGATGRALKGVRVTLWARNWREGHRSIASAHTDEVGLVRFDRPKHRDSWSYFLMAQRGDEISLDLSNIWFRDAQSPTDATASLVYTDRSVYRPMQKIFWKVLVYHGRRDLGQFSVSPGTMTTLSLVDPNNQTVETATVTTNEFGTASGEFIVPGGRPLGSWRIQSSHLGSQAIRVEEYKRPTFEASFKDPTDPLRLNRSATLTGEVKYYFGLPVVNGSVKWRVTRQSVYPWWWGWWGRSTSTDAQTIAVGTSGLSPEGTFTVQFTPKADERLATTSKETTYRFVVTADVTDEGGETRSTTRSFRLGFMSVEATIELAEGFVAEGTSASLSIRRTNLDGAGRAGNGAWRLYTLEQPARALLPADEPEMVGAPGDPPDAYHTPGDSLRPRWDRSYSPERTLRTWKDGPERSHGVTIHNDTGSAAVQLDELPPGAYRITYETKDDFGAIYETSREFMVAGPTTVLPLPLVAKVEKGFVPVGGTARVLVFSGVQGAPLYVDIYKGGALAHRRVLTAGRDSTIIDIPVGEDDRGGFGLTVMTVADHQIMQFSQAIYVPWDNKDLAVSFSTFRDKLTPGSHEEWKVTVKGPGDSPLEANAAEILAYMYDRSLDIFAPHSPPNPRFLYPTRVGAPAYRISLGSVDGEIFEHAYFSEPLGYPVPGVDRLKAYDSYGIGGPGGRMGHMHFKSGSVMRSAVPPAPMAMEAESSAEVLSPQSSAVGREEVSDAENPAEAPAASEAPAEEALRSDFAETAFWEPHLITDRDGSASIQFTVPDAVTAWNVWIHAVTRDLRSGARTVEAKTVKDLMVRPYVPRFLREGDRAEIKVVVNNASDAPMQGDVTLDIIDPDTHESLLEAFGLSQDHARLPFSVSPGGGTSVSFTVAAPKKVGTAAFKVMARSGDLSDGELRPLPVLPGRMHLVQSRFVTLRNKDRKVMTFEDLAQGGDPTLVNDQMVVTVDAQLFFTVLQALPYLVNYPYECTEQTLNRFLSTGIVSSLYDQYPAIQRMAAEFAARQTRLETFDEADPNRTMLLEESPWLQQAQGGRDSGHGLTNVLDSRIAKAERDVALAKLCKAQTSLGAFPWWAGGPPSPYMTLYIMHGFAKGLEFGVDVPKDMVRRGWSYLARYFRDELRVMMDKDCCWEFLTLLNYVATCYPDPSWTGDMLTPEEREEILAFSFKHWRDHSPYLKGYLTLTLKRAGRLDDAQLVWDSVMDSAKRTEDQGTFWAQEDRSWLWYNDTIETHAFALRTLTELRPQDPHRDGLVQWLLLNKKLNQWKSTKATAEVIYSLVHYLKAEGALGIREDATVTVGNQTVTFTFEPDTYTGKKNQIVIPGDKVGPETATVVVEKEAKGFAFASATWHFSTEKLPEAERGDFFQVSRHYFRRESTGSGFVLKPLAEGAKIAVGDQIEVQISLRSKHEAEYVHLRDPRAAGLEPENAVSRFKWDLGIGWYEEVRDSGNNFFFERLPVGEYTFKYRLRANMAGTFKVSPATVQSMYAPEFNAYSTGAMLTIVAAE